MRRYVIPALLALLLFALLVAFSPWRAPRAAPSSGPQAGLTQVGLPTGGQHAFEFVGRLEQDGANFISVGYLSHISGLAVSQLFSTTNPLLTGESNARFTFVSRATLTARFVISSVFVLDSVGQTVIYLQDAPHGDFADPASFASGTPIMTATVRAQSITNVQSPNTAVIALAEELGQTAATPFTLGGQVYQLGRPGLLERSAATGEATRTDPVAPRSFAVLAGQAIVTYVPSAAYLPVVQNNAP
jgi:hypothetical protein